MRFNAHPNVLILAYSISPVRGSEYSVGWNHIINISRFCNLTVLYGLAGPHMGDFDEIENFLKLNGPLPNVRFVPIRPSFFARFLNYPNRHGFLTYSFYLAYTFWHRSAAKKAKLLLANEPFDLVHYLCPIGYREPGYLWQFKKPYIWGPIGGMTPFRILKGRPISTGMKAKMIFKNFINNIQLKNSRRVYKAMKRSDILVASTTQTSNIIENNFHVEAKWIPENAIPDSEIQILNTQDKPEVSSLTRLIWIGSLNSRKSPDLLIDVIGQMSEKTWHLDIVGSGPMHDSVISMIASLDLSDKVTMHGQIGRNEVKKLLTLADLHIITSMQEANTTVIFEAMAAGVPTISLDHMGMHDTICDVCGVLVPIFNYQRTRDLMASKIDQLVSNSRILSSKKKGVLQCMQQHLWSNRAKKWLEIYEEAIINHESKKI